MDEIETIKEVIRADWQRAIPQSVPAIAEDLRHRHHRGLPEERLEEGQEGVAQVGLRRLLRVGGQPLSPAARLVVTLTI